MPRSTYFGVEWLESRVLLSGTTLAWQTVAPMPIPRAEASKAVVNGKMYVVGGFNDSSLHVSKEVDCYNPATNAWTRVADCPAPETHGAMAVYGNDLYLAGFFYNNGVTASNLVYKYDTVSNTWTQEPSLPGKRGAAGVAVVGNELHVWGGLTGQQTSAADHWALNLDNPSAGWQTLAALPQPLDHVGSLALNGDLWSIGGFKDKEETNGNLNVVYRYDPSTNQWSTYGVAQLPEGLGHIGPDTTVAGDNIIIAGGQINDTYEHEITQVLEYVSATNQWITLTSLPAQRKSACCGYIDGKLIVAGGNQPTSPFVSNVTWAADFTADDPAGSISGSIFNDLNGNGVRDAGEPPLAGWGVFLDANNNGVFDAGTDTRVYSDANGNYTFGNLPAGQYHLVENTPKNWIRTVPAGSSYTVDLTGGQIVTGKNFGASQGLGSISGTIFNDTNGNGNQDAGEPGLQYWGVFLDFNNNGVFDAGTDVRVYADANGHYSFTGLTAGVYHLVEITPIGWTRTVPLTSTYTVDLSAFENVTGKNFGAQPPSLPTQNLGSISGNIFNDLNGNGVLDFGEPALVGWGVFWDVNNNGVFDPGVDVRVYSDANGHYSFTNLAPGQYHLVENTPSGWARTVPLGSVYVINLSAAQIVTGKNFGVNQGGSISGTIFNDLNGNGRQDAGEPGLIGWGVFLDFNNNGIFDPGVDVRYFSDANGNYSMTNLSPGVYHLVEITPTGWTRTVPLSSKYTVTLALFQSVTGFDFGARLSG